MEQLKRYFVVGGLAEAVKIYVENKENLFDAFSKVRKKQADLLTSYYADVAKHSGKVNAMHIDRIFRSVAHQLSQHVDGSIARFKFKGIVPGVSHYSRLVGAIDWLEAAGLIFKVSIVNSGYLPFQGYAEENFFKLMLSNIGILGTMTRISPKVILEANYGSYKGYFTENFIAEELRSDGKDKLYCWQESRAEVDLLLEVEGQVIPVEIKSGLTTKTKS